MLKKVILLLAQIILFFSLGFNLAWAEVVINEIQLLPTTERFVELYNTGGEAVDLAGWYMQRKTTTGNTFGSLVSNPNFAGKTIGAHGFFVISSNSLSNSDIVLSDLTLTESNTIQIKNSNEEVVDKVGFGSVSDCGNPCPSNPPEGQSIQKTENGSWITATPTPGDANENSVTPPFDDSDDSSSDENTSATSLSSSGTKSKTEIKTIEAQISANSLAYVGIPMQFQGKAFGLDGEQLFRGRYFWNFGDGDFREIKVTGTDKFTHIYFYPGEYTVLFEYYPNYFADVPDATDKVIIKVVSPEIVISRVGDEKDFFIGL